MVQSRSLRLLDWNTAVTEREPGIGDVDMIHSSDAGEISDGEMTEDLSELPLPEKMPSLTCAEKRVVSGDFLGTGTLENSVGREQAETVFARTKVYERPRRSAARKLGRAALQ